MATSEEGKFKMPDGFEVYTKTWKVRDVVMGHPEEAKESSLHLNPLLL